jgi:hypothetical protein
MAKQTCACLYVESKEIRNGCFFHVQCNSYFDIDQPLLLMLSPLLMQYLCGQVLISRVTRWTETTGLEYYHRRWDKRTSIKSLDVDENGLTTVNGTLSAC